MKVIITGSSGFVGQNLLAYLASRHIEIEGLSLRHKSWRNTIDKHADVIIHLAGKAHDTANTSNSEEYFEVNRDLTINLFKVFLDSGIKDFFYFSSVKAVADTIDGELKEDITCKPITPYGQSKYEAEKYLLSQQLPQGKRLFIIRPCIIHGPGNKGNLNLLYKVVEKGMPWPLAVFKNERSFLSIDNLSFLVHQMLQNKDVPSGVFNFADDQSISMNELIRIISNTLSKKPKLWKIPTLLIISIIKLGDLLRLPLNSERLKKLTENYIVSNKKIKDALGINTLPLTTKQGLIKTIQSFKNNLN